ncbi:MAG: hypothetical protein NC821_02655 [Candidatus Omnitrophica bacterium]|nr:hypothetical protein [Candidatus Omnitrophota bacterium]
MKERIFFSLFLIFSSPLTYGENNWQEGLFVQSPRIEYLKKELQKRESIYKLIETAAEKVSNPLLFRERIIYLIHSLEIEKEKFLILKEVAEISSLLEKTEKEIQLYENIENLFPLSFPPSKLSPPAKLWQEKESNWLNEEVKRKNEEKYFYLNLLKENFNIENKLELNKIFYKINTGFEKEIVKKKGEILAWEENYFLKKKEKYPQLSYYLKVSTSLPYVYFYLPLTRSIDKEIYNFLLARDKLELKILELENSFAEEEISLKLHYLRKKKEILREILNKIEGIKGLSLSFEEFSSLKDIFLKTSLSLINLEYKEAMLREEILRYNLSPPEKKPEPLPPLFSFYSLLEFVEANSLYLEKMRKEVSAIKKLASSSGGTYRDYLQHLYTWKEASYEKEKTYLEKELFSLWYRLKLSQEKHSLEKEKEILLHSLYKLISQSPAKPVSEKKLKEIELLSEQLSLEEREEEIVLNWLQLRRKIATPLEIDLSSTEEGENKLEELYAKYFPETNLPEREREAYKRLRESEVSLFLRKEGKVVSSPKEELLQGKLRLNFILEIISPPIYSYTWEENYNPEAYFRLREQFEKENEEKEKNCNQELQKISQKRIQSLKERLAEEEEVSKDLEKNFSLDLPERLIQQKLRILRLKKQILEKEGDYLIDFLSSQNLPSPTLQPHQEKILLEKLSPIIKKERLPLLIKEKEKESLIESLLTSLALKNQKEKNNKLLSLYSALNETLTIFSLKEKISLILPEELSEFKLIRDSLEEEIYANERKIINLRKKEIFSQEIRLPAISNLKERIDSLNNKEIISADPYLKLVEQEINLSLPQEIDFLHYLYQEREVNLKRERKFLLQNLSLQEALLDSRKRTEKLSEEQLKNALQDLKTGVISLYGAYGLNSILSKYREEIEKLLQAEQSLAETQIRLWNLIENKAHLNLLSLIPPQFVSFREKVIASLRKELSLIRDRKKRREEFIFKNYNQKIHAFKFLKEEEEKKKIYKPIEQLFKTAREKELENTEYLDKLWEEEKAFSEMVKKKIAKSGIEIEEEILPIAESLLFSEEKKEILKLLFINYARRLKKEGYLKESIKDIQKLFVIFPLNSDEIDALSFWWAKYISPLLPYPEKIYLEEIIDPRLLGLYLYYAELKRYLALKDMQSLLPQIEKDKAFLFSEPFSLPQEKVPEYLSWEAEKQREMENLFFSQWPFENLENKRKKLLQSSKEIFGYTYGSLKEKTLQKEIVNWLIISGIAEEEFPSFIEIVETVLKEIKEVFPDLPFEEKLKIKEAVRLRWLFSQKEEFLLKEEEKRLGEAILMGSLLSWCEFFWENQIGKDEIPLFFSFIVELRKNPLFSKIYGKEENQKNERREFYISSLSYWAEKWLKFYRENPGEAEEKIKISLARFQVLYSLPSFQKLYGPIDLSTINPQKGKERKLLREFMGKMGFFLNTLLFLH